MVTACVPEAGDLILISIRERGCEQGNRRPALGLTDQTYSRPTGLAAVCPFTWPEEAVSVCASSDD